MRKNIKLLKPGTVAPTFTVGVISLLLSGLIIFMETSEIEVTLRKCPACKVSKKLSQFYSNKGKPRGIESSCKDCYKKRLVYPRSKDLTIVYLSHELNNEIWQDIFIGGILYPYSISDCGRVLIKRTNKIATPSFDQRGYPQIVISCKAKRTSRRIHVLVASAFIENKDNLPEVNHIDGNKLYPHKRNLEYSTHKGNIEHAIRLGLRKPFDSFNHPTAKKVLNTKTGKIYPSAAYVERLFNISKNLLSPKLRGKRKNDSIFLYV